MTTLGDTSNTESGLPRIPVSIESTADSPLAEHVLRPDEPLADGLQRIIVAQYDRMLDAFDAPPDAIAASVHAVRKAQKRIRAMLRLVRSEIPETTYRTENDALRDMARDLGEVRDGHVQMATLAALERRFADIVAPGVFADAHTWLDAVRRRRNTELLTDRVRIDGLRSSIEAGRARWSVPQALDDRDGTPLPDRFASIERGLLRTYRAGRRGHKAARTGATTESLHAWRKSVKYLRYELETLSTLWPDIIDAQVARLDRLGELLGDEHDLAVLHTALGGSPDHPADTDTAWLLGAVTARRRVELTNEARALGPSLYAEHPDAFVDRMRGYWVTGRGPGSAAVR